MPEPRSLRSYLEERGAWRGMIVVVFDPVTRECRRYDSRTPHCRATHECTLQPGSQLTLNEAYLIEHFRSTPFHEFKLDA